MFAVEQPFRAEITMRLPEFTAGQSKRLSSIVGSVEMSEQKSRSDQLVMLVARSGEEDDYCKVQEVFAIKGKQLIPYCESGTWNVVLSCRMMLLALCGHCCRSVYVSYLRAAYSTQPLLFQARRFKLPTLAADVHRLFQVALRCWRSQ